MASFKTKDRIKRKQLRNHLLKRVIIRFDFTSIVNLQNVLDQIVEYFKTIDRPFDEFDRMMVSNDVAEGVGKNNPNEKTERSFVYRFSDCRIEPIQDVTLDFANNYLCLDIRCDEHYKGIDKYLEIMKEIMSIVIENDTYVQLTRMGIRKIDGIDSITPNEADNVFEYFSQKLDWGKEDKMYSRNYIDNMFCEDVQACVTYSRIVRVVSGGGKLRFTMDIDCFKEATMLEKRPKKSVIKSSLQAMNNKLFELFVLGIKLEYFNENM